MSGFLLDTNVISMLSPSRGEVSKAFINWAEDQDSRDQLYLSAVTIHEIEKGIALLESKGASAKATGIRLWLSGLTTAYDDRILPITVAVAALSGQLEASAIASGHSPGMADALIAGSAKSQGLTIVTHNLKHFLHFDVAATSPMEIAAG